MYDHTVRALDRNDKFEKTSKGVASYAENKPKQQDKNKPKNKSIKQNKMKKRYETNKNKQCSYNKLFSNLPSLIIGATIVDE